MRVEVAYGTSARQILVVTELAAGGTARDALTASGVLERYPELDPGGRNPVGIFGRPVPLDTPLNEGDRVEVYRPLRADPKETRRRRARAGRPG